ncbi:glycosyltransferase [Fibrobacter sp.]|uniref:glycosyltransferase n=1 Tax=Fibrobacter sp. TaxID=35828 RepID=UPI0025C5AC0B|nr:glycosyltransferase [Fibrobacter sp.]MBR3071708.1 glycosyltransferase [Fibrobacter sp.]
MKILFVIRDMIIGGAGKQLALTANALLQKGHDIYIYSYFGGDCKHYLHPTVTYIAQDPVPSTKLKEYLFSVPNIRKQMKKIKPDIAISWRCNAGCFTVLAALGLPLKTIFSERSDPYTETSFLLKISAFICNFSNGGVFQTEAVQKYYKRLSSRSVVIHNPFDKKIQNLAPISFANRKKEIVHIARMMIVQKRQDVMLKAFKIFLQKHPDYTLSFYGSGPDFEKIRSLAQTLNIESNVIFHGDVVDVANKIGNTKMLVLTSDYEGIPNVIMEAFAMEVPVVSTDCSPGGARVLINDGKNGFIVPVGNASAIAEKMDQLIEFEKISEEFILNGKEKLKEFKAQPIFDKWNHFLEEIKRR